MRVSAMLRDFNLPALSAGVNAFIFMVFGALTLQISVIQEFNLTHEAQSWVFVTWLTSGIVSLAFIIHYRQPLTIGWTIPGLVYMGSLADRFSFEEFAAANAVAGAAILVLGMLGVGSRVIQLVPLPILMGMFAASVVGFITRMVEATADSVALVGPMVAAYLVGRRIHNPRLPPIGLGVVAGAVMIAALGRVGNTPIEVGLPQVAVTGMAFRLEAIATVSVPMVVLVLGLGNVQGLGFLVAQGYRVPADAITIAVGGMSIVNALLGGHPAAMTRISSAMVGGPAAGAPEKRYWAAIVAFLPAALVALATGPILALIALLPSEYIVAVAGLAIFASFEDALARAFSGPLRCGAAIAFAATLSTFVVAGIPSAFWALVAGVGASFLLERSQLLDQWRLAIQRTEGSEASTRSISEGPRVRIPILRRVT